VWVVSVVVASTLLSFARDSLLPHRLARGVGPTALEMPAAARRMALARREDAQDACAANAVAAGEYDVPLHVGALLIVLGVSSLACGLPMLAAKFPVLRIPKSFFFAVRHFGTGVLLATAFVHLLPTAFLALGDPCLSSFWTKDYPPMPGAIALMGIFFVTIIEMVFSPARHFTPRAVEEEAKSDGVTAVRRTGGGLCGHPDVAASVTRQTSRVGRGSIEPAPPQNGLVGHARSEDALEGASHHHALTPEQQHKKSILQCMLLEMGILFHSVFIGMALSIAIGGDFVVLLIAITFHRKSPLPCEMLHD